MGHLCGSEGFVSRVQDGLLHSNMGAHCDAAPAYRQTAAPWSPVPRRSGPIRAGSGDASAWRVITSHEGRADPWRPAGPSRTVLQAFPCIFCGPSSLRGGRRESFAPRGAHRLAPRPATTRQASVRCPCRPPLPSRTSGRHVAEPAGGMRSAGPTAVDLRAPIHRQRATRNRRDAGTASRRVRRHGGPGRGHKGCCDFLGTSRRSGATVRRSGNGARRYL